MIFGRKVESDIEDLRPQHARYLPTGAEVVSEARDRISYRLDGRGWSPFVERGPRVYSVYIDLHPTWNDGTSMTDDDLHEGVDVMTEVLKHWGVDEVEVVWPTEQGGSTA